MELGAPPWLLRPTVREKTFTATTIIRFDEFGNLCTRNLSAYWIPKLTVTEEISGTVYTVTGSYEGEQSFLRKLERIAAKNYSKKLEADHDK